ncbi:MAG: hypothetical protein JNL82_11465 [Myxococcales bacterium]|nr:hypothetical protein [Myxococcales bacterium]
MSFKTAFFAFLKREKSQAELEGYRHATNQIDELDAAIQTQILAKPPTGGTPWSYALHQQQAMAYAWIARGLATIANTLIEIDEKTDAKTAGYLPIVTFTQARELYVQVPEYVRRAWEAMSNPNYRPDKPLPAVLSPRIEADGKCPMVHLLGIHAAATALDGFVEARVNELMAARGTIAEGDQEARGLLDELAQVRARARSERTFAGDQLRSLGDDVPIETHEAAENRLFNALSDQFLLGQLVAMPSLARSPALIGHNSKGREVRPEDRWFLSEDKAIKDLKDTKFGEQEIKEFWVRKNWRTTPVEERYLAQCAALVANKAISVASRWSTCPFDPAYQTHESVQILDRTLPRGTEFHLNMDEGEDELQVGTPRFRRTQQYEEEHEEGHHDDASGT